MRYRAASWISARALSALLVACSVGVGLGSVPAHAQGAARGERVRWQYCAITVSYGTDTDKGNAAGYVRVVTFEPSGPREEVIKVEGEAIDPAGKSPEPYERIRLAAVSKAMAMLGDAGWELVGELMYKPSYASGEEPQKALYFKRRMEEQAGR